MTKYVLLVCLVVGSAILAEVFAALWVYKDAKQRGLQAVMWMLLVILGGNFIGLILYLLIGRKQGRVSCTNCGATTNMDGTFCSVCGQPAIIEKPVIKTNKYLLIACITCIALVFVSVGFLIHASYSESGFEFEKQYSYFHTGSDGYAKKASQDSSGDTWDLSYSEVSGGYTFIKSYNVTSAIKSLSVDIHCKGTVQLIITQNGETINETIKEGTYNYDMSKFSKGRINMKIVNIDSSNFSGKLVVK